MDDDEKEKNIKFETLRKYLNVEDEWILIFSAARVVYVVKFHYHIFHDDKIGREIQTFLISDVKDH